MARKAVALHGGFSSSTPKQANSMASAKEKYWDCSKMAIQKAIQGIRDRPALVARPRIGAPSIRPTFFPGGARFFRKSERGDLRPP